MQPRHAFGQSLAMVYLDLDELPRLFRGSWLYGFEKPRPASFRRRDHLGDPARPLAECVRSLVEQRTGERPRGPVRLLTQLRSFGLAFNPLSLHFCFDEDGATPRAIVADVTNTPWNERHAYVLPVQACEAGVLRFTTPKAFHVSPFLGMRSSYRWRIGLPGPRLHARIESWNAGRCEFVASIALERRELAAGELVRAWLRFPFASGQVLAGIYWQALRLWRKGAPFHPHPGRSRVRHEEGIRA
jgi:hypothetical protein